jgi:hypothetical protein
MNRSILMLRCMLTRSDIRSSPEQTVVVCSTSKAAIMASPLKPEDVYQLKGSVGGIIELPGKLPSQMGNILEIDSVVRSVPVVSGHPDIQAQV